MAVTLVLPSSMAGELEKAACQPLESGGVLTARILDSPNGDLRLLGREFHSVHDSAYLRRETDGLTVASEGYVHALGRAEEDGAIAIWVHTHPGVDSWPRPSPHDRIVDTQLADLFRLRTNSDYYGALILSPRERGLCFTGQLHGHDGRTPSIDRLWIVGDRLRLYRTFDAEQTGLSPSFDRNVRAFGKAVQETLSDLRIGIVGCGGTGSAVAEQLVRLGVTRFTLIDPDHLSESNVTRVYGSFPRQVGRPKVDVLSAHLRAVAEGAQVEAVNAMLTTRDAAQTLTGLDVVFGCTDDNAGRLVLSRAATYLLMPVIDCGVLLTSTTDGTLSGIDGRVTVLTPGQACLVCRGRVDLSRAAAELLTPAERVRRADEGYAPALGAVEPAVVTFTTAVACAAVAELLERLIGYGPEYRPSEILLRHHDREISTNSAEPRKNHYCDPITRKIGLGRTEPFLEQAWAV
ncbi:MAG: ThiF family adenylyltransferase [Acidobacteria bacterium]|nr:ThiF family adenylyltransferase [Acidobacteriota bacterium]